MRLRIALLLLCGVCLASAEVKRIVMIKADGVPADILDRFVEERDPLTGKSVLPWIESVFHQHGSHVANYYTRGISLSAPAWSLLDSGQHLQIRGNAEYDRYTGHVYDYLNFFPFYVNYARSRRVDMPGVEVLHDSRIPLLVDRFGYQERYQSFQLFQEGVRWTTLQNALTRRFSKRSPQQLLSEWQIGFDLGAGIPEEMEAELIRSLQDPRVRYLDLFTGDFDHAAHAVRDTAVLRNAARELDALVGRIWTASQNVPLGPETALVLVSDHGINANAGQYSQGFSLIDWFTSVAGGGHHVVTNRHPLEPFKLKGLNPFVDWVVTPSAHSTYLEGRAEQFPTVLLDLDGNERAAAYLRNSDLNVVHILLTALGNRSLSPALHKAIRRALFAQLAEMRPAWDHSAAIGQELAALRRAIERMQAVAAAEPKQWSQADRDAGLDKDARRVNARLERWQADERDYETYLRKIKALFAFTCENCDLSDDTVLSLVPHRSMGEPNSLYQLQHYVVGVGARGFVLRPDGELDREQSFRRLNYFAALSAIRTRNQAQPGVSRAPIDFTAMRLPRAGLVAGQPSGDFGDEDAVWLYRSEADQLLLLFRHGGVETRVLPVSNLRQDATGRICFDPGAWRAGLPLALYEDPNLAVATPDRAFWLREWHSEQDWFRATHRTRYSNAVIGLHEHFATESKLLEPCRTTGICADDELLLRFQERERSLARADLLVLAHDRWNFNTRNFNPGGNHGSFFRPSTHGILYFAGGAKTGIPAGLTVTEPYDSLSLLPTVLDLLGEQACDGLHCEGYPGPIIGEIAPGPRNSGTEVLAGQGLP